MIGHNKGIANVVVLKLNTVPNEVKHLEINHIRYFTQ
jgi:hypothetical protein